MRTTIGTWSLLHWRSKWEKCKLNLTKERFWKNMRSWLSTYRVCLPSSRCKLLQRRLTRASKSLKMNRLTTQLSLTIIAIWSPGSMKSWPRRQTNFKWMSYSKSSRLNSMSSFKMSKISFARHRRSGISTQHHSISSLIYSKTKSTAVSKQSWSNNQSHSAK
jgi:hypothetical protein